MRKVTLALAGLGLALAACGHTSDRSEPEGSASAAPLLTAGGGPARAPGWKAFSEARSKC